MLEKYSVIYHSRRECRIMRTISDLSKSEQAVTFRRYFPNHNNRKHQRVAEYAYSAYKCSNKFCLEQCYGRYSQAKENAMDYCLNLMEMFEGEGFRIISHNCNVFSVGFEFVNPITGVLSLAYITRDYNRCCDIPYEE